MADRITLKKTEHGWVHIEFEDVKKDDVIQVYEPDGTLVAAVIATSDAKEDENTMMGFSVDHIPPVLMNSKFVLSGVPSHVDPNFNQKGKNDV